MPIYNDLTPKAFWRNIKASKEDRTELDPIVGRTMLSQLHLIRF